MYCFVCTNRKCWGVSISIEWHVKSPTAKSIPLRVYTNRVLDPRSVKTLDITILLFTYCKIVVKKKKQNQTKMDQNLPNWRTWPFDLVEVNCCFLRGPLTWLTAAKNRHHWLGAHRESLHTVTCYRKVL